MVKKKEIKKKKFKTDEDIAFDFASKTYNLFKETIKSIVLFGSVAKGEEKKKSDVDIVIIADDCTVQWDEELIAWYREELGKLIEKQNYPKKLHVTTLTLTSFWEQIKVGEPVAINIIRYGKTLIDFGGFFDPLKILLERGKIKPTPEAIYTVLKRAPVHLSRAKFSIFSVIESLYWAMVDASHAALMAADIVPPSPEHVANMLDKTFVREGKLKRRYVEWYKEMFALAHYVTHGEIVNVSGKQIDMYRKRADKFVGELSNLVKNLKG